MAYNYETHKAQLAAQWARMKILRKRSEMDRVARKLIAKKAIYQGAERATGVPWWMVAVIDLREGGESHLGTRHLHCGDPLSNYTIHVPAGRPKVGHGPPFTWLESAVDALKMKLFDKVKDWPIERVLHELEPYNGLGYHSKGIPSPYIWSCTNIYDPPYGPGGKYTADHVFTPGYVDQQVGCAPLLKVMADLDASIVLRSWKDAAPAPVPPPPDIPPPDPDKPILPPPTPAEHWGVWVSFGAVVSWIAHMLDGHWMLVVALAAIIVGLAAWLSPKQ